jgi:hypothetical protein
MPVLPLPLVELTALNVRMPTRCFRSQIHLVNVAGMRIEPEQATDDRALRGATPFLRGALPGGTGQA